MRKVITILLVLILVLTCSFTLISCVKDDGGGGAGGGGGGTVVPKPEPEPDPEPDKPTPPPVTDPNIRYWSIDQVFEYMGKSFGRDKNGNSIDVVCFKTPIKIVTAGDVKYKAQLNGNLNVVTKDVEFYASIRDAATNASVFGVIIADGKLFIEVGKLKLHIENTDMAYIIDILKQIFPQIIPELDKLLGNLLNMTVKDIVALVMPMLFSYPYTYLNDNTYDISFDITLNNLLDTVFGLVGGLNLDGILAGAGVKLPEGLSINGIIKMVQDAIPKINISVSTKLEVTGLDEEYNETFRNGGINVSVTDENGENMLGMESTLEFAAEKGDIGLPKGLNSYDPFSITQMQFSVSLGANIKQLDVGALIKEFAGKELLPLNTVMLSTDLGFTLKFQLDLNLKKDAENLLLVEIYRGTDTKIAKNRLAGIYFIDGKIKINVDQVTPVYQGKNIEIIFGRSLTGEGGLLTGYLDMMKNLIDQAVKDFTAVTPPEGGDPPAALSAIMQGDNAYNDGNLVVPLAMTTDQDGVVQAETGITLLGFINSLLSMVKLNDNIILTPEKGINIIVNKKLFDVLGTFAPAMKDKFDSIANMIGNITLDVNMQNFDFLKISSIDLKWDKNADTHIELSVHDMLFGFAPTEIRENIINATKDREYVSNLQDILYSVMKGVDISAGLKLTIPQGDYDIIGFIKSLGIPELKLPIDGGILRIPAGGLELDLNLIVQFQLDKENHKNSKAKVELYLNKDAVAGSGDFLFFKKGLLLGVYADNDTAYLDLNGFKPYGLNLPKVSLKINLMDMLYRELNKININLVLTEMIPGLKPSPTTPVADTNGGSTGVVGSGGIDININHETLKFALTSIALQNLLKAFNINMTLPKFDLTLEIDKLQTIKLSVSLELAPDKALALELNLDKLVLGKSLEIALPDPALFKPNLNSFIQGAIDDALSGLSLDFKLMLEAKGGIIPIGEILGKLGVAGVPNININVGGDPTNPGKPGDPNMSVVLDCTLQLRTAFVVDDPTTSNDESLASKLSLELFLNKSIMGIKAGKLLGAYSKEGKLYIDLSGFKIDEMSLPMLSLNLNVPKLLMKQMSGIDLDTMIDKLLVQAGLRDPIPVVPPKAAVADNSAHGKAGDIGSLDPADYPILELNKEALVIAITSNAIASLLGNLGIFVQLPDFDVRFEINSINGIFISLSGLSNGDAANAVKLLKLDLSLTNIQIGGEVATPSVDVIVEGDYPSSMSQMLKDTIAKVMSGAQMSLKLNVEVEPMTLYLDELLAMLGISFGALNPGDNAASIVIRERMTLNLEIKLKFQYDKNYPENSACAIEIFLKNQFFLQPGNPEGRLIGVYGIGANTFVDLSGIKIDGASLPKVKLKVDLMKVVLDQIAKIDIDKIINDELGKLQPVADKPFDAVMPKDPTIIINQDTFAIRIMSDALIAMLGMAGIKLELPFGFNLGVDVELGENSKKGITIQLETTNQAGVANTYNIKGNVFIGDFAFGKKVITPDVDIPSVAEQNLYKTTLKDALVEAANNLLDGTTFTAQLQLTLKQQKYDIGEFLGNMGVMSKINNLFIDVQTAQTLDIKMVFKVRTKAQSGKARGLSLQFYLASAPLFIGELVDDPNKPILSIISDNDGKTYIDLSNIILSEKTVSSVTTGVRLPKITLPIDLLTTLDTYLGSLTNLDDMFNNWLNPPKPVPPADATPVTGVADPNGSALKPGLFLDLGLTDQRVDLKVAAEAIAAVLNLTGLQIALPPMSIDGYLDVSAGAVDNPNGLGLNLKVFKFGADLTNLDHVLAEVSLKVKDLKLGNATVEVESLTPTQKNEYSKTLTEGLQGALSNILNGMNIQADLNLRLSKGSYNIGDLLKAFNVPDGAIAGISIPTLKFTNDVVLHLRLSFIIETFDKAHPENNKFELKLTLLEDLIPYAIIGANGQPTSEKGAIIKANTDLMKVFAIGDGKTYVDLSGIKFANLSLPRFYIDLDVLSLLNTIIEQQKLDKLIEDFINTKINGKPVTPPAGDVTPVADNGAVIPTLPTVDVVFAGNAIKVMATSQALLTLLGNMGLNLPLPEALKFDMSININGLGVYDNDPNLELKANVDMIEGVSGIDGIVVGDKKYLATFRLALETIDFNSTAKITNIEDLKASAAIIKAECGDMIKYVIYDVIKTVDIELSANLNIAETKMDLTKLINQLLSSSNQHINIPINLNLDNLDQEVHFAIKWNLDFKKHLNSEAYIMLYTDSRLFEVKIIYKNNCLYVDLSKLGLLKFKVENFNLTALIDSLISKMIPLLNTDMTNMILSKLFPNNSQLQSVGGVVAKKPTYMERAEQQTLSQDAIAGNNNKLDVMKLVNALLQNLTLTDLIANIDLQDSNVKDILASVGIGLGMSLNAQANVNISEGSLKLDVKVNESEVGLGFKINKIGGGKSYIDWTYFTEKFVLNLPDPKHLDQSALPTQKEPADLAAEFLDYGAYSLISGADLIMSVLTSMKSTENPGLGLTSEKQPEVLVLNLENKNQADRGGNEYDNKTKVVISRVLEYSKVVGGKYTARQGSLIIALYKSYDYNTPIAYVTLNPKDRNLNILGTKNLFTVLNIVGGELVNINIPLDLGTLVGGMLDPIIKKIPSGVIDGGTTTTPTADPTGMMDGIDASKLDIEAMIRNITLTVMNTGHIRAFADINATALNDLLVKLLGNLFWTMDLGDLAGNKGPMHITYNNAVLDSSTAFFNEFWDKMLLPIIERNVGKAVKDIAGAVKSQIKNTIDRILPLARFDRITLAATILSGTISDIAIDTRRKIPGKQYDDKNLPDMSNFNEWDYEMLSLEVENCEARDLVSYEQFEVDEKNWQGQSNNVIYDPYEKTDLSKKFNTGGWRYHAEMGRWMGGTKSAITWKAVNNSGTPIGIAQPNTNNGTDWNNQFVGNSPSLKSSCGKVDPNTGATVYTLIAQTDFSGASMPVKVTVLPKGTITGIQDILVPEHADVSNTVMVNMDVDLGGGNILATSRAIDADVLNAARKLPYADGEVLEKDINNPKNGPYVNIGGADYAVKVTYLSSKVSKYERAITIDAYSMNDFLKTLPTRMFFAYANGASSSALVEWDVTALTALTPEQMIAGTPKDQPIRITARIQDEINLGTNGADTRQIVEFDVTILSTIPRSVMFDGEINENLISVDPFAVLDAKAAAKSYNTVFPTKTTVTYQDGHTDVRDIAWTWTLTAEDLAGGKTPDQYLESLCTPEGGNYLGKLTIINTLGDIRWSPLPVELVIKRRMPKYIKFGVDTAGADIKTLHINPYAAMLNGVDSVMPKQANIVYEQGYTRTLPIAWDTTNIVINPNGGSFIVPVTIAPGTSLERKLTVPVAIDRLVFNRIGFADNRMIFENAPEILYGGAKKEAFIPKTVPMYVDDGNGNEVLMDIPATVDFRKVNVTRDGNGYGEVATATIGSGQYAQTFTYLVVINESKLLRVEDSMKDYWVEMDEVRTLGSNLYPKTYKFVFQNGQKGEIVKELPVTWDDYQVNTISREAAETGFVREIPGNGGTLKAIISESTGLTQTADVNLHVGQLAVGLPVQDGKIQNTLTLDFSKAKVELPKTFPMVVSTVKINNDTNSKTKYDYTRTDYPVTWDIGKTDLVNGGLIEAVVMAGTRLEQRFSVIVTANNAPLLENLTYKAGQSAIEVDYADLLAKGVNSLPGKRMWTNTAVSGAEYLLNTAWDLSVIDFKTLLVNDNCEAKVDIPVSFILGGETGGIANGTQNITIYNIPALLEGDKTKTLSYFELTNNLTKHFKPSQIMKVSNKISQATGGISWNFADVNAAIDANNKATLPTESITANVKMTINKGTAYELNYTLALTVVGLASLKATDVAKTITYTSYTTEQDKLFLASRVMVVGGKDVTVNGITWDLSRVEKAIADNKALPVPAAQITTIATMVLYAGTPHVVTYDITLTITGMTAIA